MSKSLGNFFSVRELLDQGYPGEVIRFVFLSTHYRKPMDWTEKKAAQFQNELHKWSTWLKSFKVSELPPSDQLIIHLANDLNTPAALTHLRALFSSGQYEQLAVDARFIGVWTGQSPSEISRQYTHDTNLQRSVSWLIDDRLRKLDQMRSEKRYDAADKIRSELFEAGVQVKSGANGTTYELTADFKPGNLEKLR